MADTAASPAPAAAASSPKKVKASKPKKPRTTPSHPKVAEMVNAAITDLKERGGSSLQAIKKYIAGNYKVDVEKLAPFIKKYLKSAVAGGVLVQTKGKGANGSFKLGASLAKKDKDKPRKVKTVSAVSEKKKAPKSPVKKAEKKKAKPKKVAAAAKKVEKPKSPKKAKAMKKAKTPKKEKKAKSPKKPKSPKPKKTAAKKGGKK